MRPEDSADLRNSGLLAPRKTFCLSSEWEFCTPMSYQRDFSSGGRDEEGKDRGTLFKAQHNSEFIERFVLTAAVEAFSLQPQEAVQRMWIFLDRTGLRLSCCDGFCY